MTARGSRGFSLPELLVNVAVAGAFLALLYPFFVVQRRSYAVQDQVADAQQSARVAVDELSRHLSSLGAGVELEKGQVRLLAAHPHEVVFSADLRSDHGSLAPGAAVPGASTTDPYPVCPPGTYSDSSPAETYRLGLDANGDGLVTTADRTHGPHYSLWRRINAGIREEVAGLVANPRVGEPLFRYWGDLNGDGVVEVADRVDRTTSPRVAAGEALDAVVQRIEVNLVTEAADPDRRHPSAAGYRQVRLATSVSPENLRRP